MSPEQVRDPEDELVELLAAYDEALAAGLIPPGGTLGTAALNPDSRARLSENEQILGLLEQAWPRSTSRLTGALTPGPAGDGTGAVQPAYLGRYRVVRELGRGGFGIVYLGIDPILCRKVAIKVPRPESLFAPELRQRFVREARAAAVLSHANLVPVLDSGEVGSLCYLVSAYCAGGSLAAHLRERREPLPVRAAAGLVAALADGLEHAHQHGILHRDLKPANVLLEPAVGDRAGLGFIPRVSDFGLAKFLEVDLSSTGVESDRAPAGEGASPLESCRGGLLGTPEYMAPEQAAGKSEALGPGVDVYGLGAILYEAPTGRPPFAGTDRADVVRRLLAEAPAPPRSLRADVPAELEAICLKCLAKAPADRYGSAQALAEELHRFLAGQPTQAGRSGRLRRLVLGSRRTRFQAGLAALCILGLAAYLGLTLLRAWQQPDSSAPAADPEALRQTKLADRRLQYALAIHSAQARLSAGELRRAGELLAAQVPAPGEQDLRDFAWHYLWGLGHRPSLALERPPTAVYALAVSPDGKRLAATGIDGVVRVWEAEGGQLRAELRGHSVRVYALAFSPDGKLLASGGGQPGEPGQLKLWDAEKLTERPAVEGPLPAVAALAFSPDGHTLAVAGRPTVAAGKSVGGDLRLFDPATGRCRQTVVPYAGTAESVLCLAWTGIGSRLVLGGSTGTVSSWTAGSNDRPAVLAAHPGIVQALACAPDHKTVAAASDDGTITVLDLPSGRVLARYQPRQDNIRSLAFAPDGLTLALGYTDGAILFCDAATWQPLDVLFGHDSVVHAVGFGRDGKTLVSGGRDGTVRVWDLSRVQAVRLLQHSPKELWWVDFSRDGRTLATGGDDHLIRLWDMPAGQLRAELKGHRALVVVGSFGPRGKLLATGDYNGLVKIWESATGKELYSIPAHAGPVRALAFSPDGQTVASGGQGSLVRLSDVGTGRQRRALDARVDPVHCLAFHPGGLLAAGGSDGRVRIWDPATATLRHTLPVGAQVRRLAFSPDGTRLAVGTTESAVVLYRTDRWEKETVLTGHTGEVRALAFAADGRSLASGGTDHRIKVWQTATGQELLTLPAHHTVSGLAFSPNGRTLACASHDGTVRLWIAPGPDSSPAQK